jgi:ATP-binding cassette subfamily B protein
MVPPARLAPAKARRTGTDQPLNSLRPLLPYARRYRWRFLWGFAFVVITNFISLKIPLLVGDLVTRIESAAICRDELALLCVVLVSVAGIAGAFRFLMRRVLIDTSRDMEYELRNDLMDRLQRLDSSFFDANNTGDLMSRATNDMDALRMLIGPAIMYSANTIIGLPLFLAGMLAVSWPLTLVALLPMAALPPLTRHFSRRTHQGYKKQQEALGNLTTMVQENLAGIRVVKAYGREDSERAKFLDRNQEYIDRSMELARVQASFFPAIGLLVGLGYVLVLMVGGNLIIGGSLSVGALLSFLMLFAMLVWPLIAAGWVVNIIQRGIASLGRLRLILDAEPRVRDGGAAAPAPDAPMDIQFDNLTFQYDSTSTPQLEAISLDVPEGRSIGIVGPVAAGKSTLVHLLARFYPVPRGMIRIGGLDVNDWPLEALRRRIAFVFQETFLFSDTIDWNIRFGAEEGRSAEEVQRAAQLAQLHDAIAEFPHGYDTLLGERGVNLSGGQKQRTALARALLKDARILVLDDCLSAVDTHTEERILAGLRDVMRGRTTFLISHRISTVALADEVIVLQNGRITQRGTHEQLVAQPGLYRDLYIKQLSEDAVRDYPADEDEEVGATP